MPFNSDTYHANKYRRRAWEELRQAREIRSRVAADPSAAWEAPRVATFVQLARCSMRLSLTYRRIRNGNH